MNKNNRKDIFEKTEKGRENFASSIDIGIDIDIDIGVGVGIGIGIGRVCRRSITNVDEHLQT